MASAEWGSGHSANRAAGLCSVVSEQARPWEPTVEWPSARQASCPSQGSCAKVNLYDDQTHAIRGSPPTGLAGKNTRTRCAPSDLCVDQHPTGSLSIYHNFNLV